MAEPRSMSMSGLEWALLLALAVLWGGSFFFSKVALAELPPLTVVLGRVVLAALALNLLIPVMGLRMPRDFGAWRAFVAMGIVNNLVPFGLIVWGQTRIGSGLASILNATTPLFTILVAHVLTRDEKLTAAKLAGVGLGIAGVAFMIGPDALGGLGDDIAGQLACLGAALSYAFAGIYGRRFKAMGLPPLVVAAGQVSGSALVVLPLACIADQPWTLPLPGPTTWGALAGLSLLCTALAYILYFRILASAGATNLLLVTFLIPATAILLGTTILGESLAARQVAGLLLIGIGLAAIDGRPLRLLGRRALVR